MIFRHEKKLGILINMIVEGIAITSIRKLSWGMELLMEQFKMCFRDRDYYRTYCITTY